MVWEWKETMVVKQRWVVEVDNEAVQNCGMDGEDVRKNWTGIAWLEKHDSMELEKDCITTTIIYMGKK